MRFYNILILSLIHFGIIAQPDGVISEMIIIKDFTALNEYITLTEGRDSIRLEYSRFMAFDDINLFGITYLSDGLKVKGFLLTPKGKKKYPAIIYNRGGSGDFASLTTSLSLGVGELMDIAARGYVVIASQYRGNGGGEGREEFGGADVNDVLNLIPILDNLDMVDPERIGMFGWSRGGMMTFLALKRTTRIKAAAVGGPLSNLDQSFKDRPEWGEYIGEMFPSYNENPDRFNTERSVINWVDSLPGDVPLLILHGTSDWRIKSSYTLKLVTEMDRLRIPYRLIVYEGSDHSITEHRGEAMAQIMDWFDRFLIKMEQLPDMQLHGR